MSSSKNKIKGALAASLTAFKKDLSLDIKLTIKHGQDLLDQGLISVSNSTISASQRGRPVLNHIIRELAG